MEYNYRRVVLALTLYKLYIKQLVDTNNNKSTAMSIIIRVVHRLCKQ